jgi:hypothetical protein
VGCAHIVSLVEGLVVVLPPTAELHPLEREMRTMQFHANHVSTSVSGDYYRALFEASGGHERSRQPLSAHPTPMRET